MANNAALIQLIKSLTKSEKRYFKLYTNRNTNKKEVENHFLVLFEALEKKKSAKTLSTLLSEFTAKQLSDIQRNLYHKILEALRVYNAKKEGFDLPNQVANARVLYNKGFYMESLDILNKCKQKARLRHNHLIIYEILEFEKKIESRHITRSHSTRARELELELNEIRGVIRSEADWSQFSLKLYAKFIQIGHVKSVEEFLEVKRYFESEMPELHEKHDQLFFCQLFRLQSYDWYHFITQNFRLGYKYSVLWIRLFEQNPGFIRSHPDLLIKGIHNCLSILYSCLDQTRHAYFLEMLEGLVETNPQLSSNDLISSFVYLNNARLNRIILSGEFTKGEPFLVQLETKLLDHGHKLDDYRLMVFWYKMASIYFTMGDYRNCVRLLNRIINPDQKALREDLQCFARLLYLIAHFELESDELLNYLIKSTYRFLLKIDQVMKIHQVLVNFLKSSIFKERHDLRDSFVDLRNQLDALYEDPYERRSFLYLDIISWLESKIEDKPVEQIIYNKRRVLTP
ncbi:MAG: hypothetical protein JJ975_14845 [Bacteroidia bacterium]|nr:hypothetical protein [Bacteroidia bacterium]